MNLYSDHALLVESLRVLVEERLAENAERQGERLRSELRALKSPIISEVRGKGLLNAVVIDQPAGSTYAWDVCMRLAGMGLLAKPTHGNIIRFAPPLVITDKEMDESLEILKRGLQPL